MADDTETVVSAPISTAAWIYVLPKDSKLIEILSILSLMEKSKSVVISPLLLNLTVENDFAPTVKTPITNYGGTIITKITSFLPVCFFFHGTESILTNLENHGDLDSLCKQTRIKFNLQEFVINEKRKIVDMRKICESVGKDPENVLCHVVVGNGFKELLFSGLLIPCIEEHTEIQIGDYSAIKIPLYSATLFEPEETFCIDTYTDFIQDRGFYEPQISEVLFYYIFTSWGMTLRFSNTIELIKAGLKQFIQDAEQTVKLAANKTYHGIPGQKLSPIEKDHLMLVDAVITELTFSYTAEYIDSVYETNQVMNFFEWPIIKTAETHEEKIEQLKKMKLHLSSHIAALVFASNSILYCNKLAYIANNKQAFNSAITQETLLRSIHFCNSLSSLNEDLYNDMRKIIKCETSACKEEKYSAFHLAYICATCPQILSHIVWNLNRMSIYNTNCGNTEIYNHIVNCSSNLCDFCEGKCCQSCINTALVRVNTRLPQISKVTKKEPIVMTMFSRFYADVDILGSFGKKGINEQKDSTKEAQTTPSLDRLKFLTNIYDYCKKNCLIDAVTGEDILSFNNQNEFVNVISGLIQCIEESVSKCITEMRKTQTSKDQIENCLQSFNIDTTPLSLVFSPFFSFTYYKVLLTVLQNLALIIATGYVVDRPCTGTHISKWLMQQYQSLYGAFHNSHFKKGFFNMKTVKIASNVDMEQYIDFALYKIGKYAKTSIQAKLCRLSMQCLRDFRVKNRPFNKPNKNTQNNPFFKKIKQKKNPLSGCLSFLLFKYHENLFPNLKISCLEFWQRILLNNMPKSVDIGNVEDIRAFIKFAFNVTNTYDEIDLLDIQPECILSFVDYYFHNKLLSVLGYRDYLTSLHGLTSKLVPQNPILFPFVLKEHPRFSSVQEYVMHIKKLVGNGLKDPIIASLAKEPNFGNIFTGRSIITFGLMLEKFVSVASRDYFHFGQLGWIAGNGVDRNLNPPSTGLQDFKFMRQKFVIATKLSNIIVKKIKRETVIFDVEIVRTKVLNIIESLTNSVNPELLIISEIMKDRDSKPTMDDMLFYVDGREPLAKSVLCKIEHLTDLNIHDYSLTTLTSIFENSVEEDSAIYDFSELLTEDNGQCTSILKCEELENDNDEPIIKKARL
ncbi:single-stranded DNA-binding protein [macacine betaherpesvirus 9]|uniref:Single-stranded DNA-binding protein n=1 Tax=macacine betaherpesvirus 9 TaxID=2560568 RepID=A0A191S3S3_9BETA|nr:single-stranded DNA-binding protein [macacine betaherpesvirus 9]ANC96518.1 single-stranded DNA-binding protein [macacine betaherpesvirus 9]